MRMWPALMRPHRSANKKAIRNESNLHVIGYEHVGSISAVLPVVLIIIEPCPNSSILSWASYRRPAENRWLTYGAANSWEWNETLAFTDSWEWYKILPLVVLAQYVALF